MVKSNDYAKAHKEVSVEPSVAALILRAGVRLWGPISCCPLRRGV